MNLDASGPRRVAGRSLLLRVDARPAAPRLLRALAFPFRPPARLLCPPIRPAPAGLLAQRRVGQPGMTGQERGRIHEQPEYSLNRAAKAITSPGVGALQARYADLRNRLQAPAVAGLWQLTATKAL